MAPQPTTLCLALALLVVAATATAAAAQPPSQLMLVVGRVDATTARILYEAVPGASNTAYTAQVWRRGEGNELELQPQHSASIEAESVPHVLRLSGLAPDVHYWVSFEATPGELPPDPSGHEGDVVQFSTLGKHTDAPLRVVVVSCDRHSQGPDSEFVASMAQDVDRTFDVMAHLGDQIYGDWLVEEHKHSSYDVVLQAYRELYRRTWGRPAMQVLMRQGSHWMIPDDHDIANALSVDLWKEHRVLVDAARRAFFEYQYQLTADVAPDTHAVGTSYEPPPLAEAQRQVRSIYSFITLRRTGLAFMDLRFERTFGLLPDYKLTGTRQLRAFEGALREWEGDEQVDAALVFSSVPFLYQAPLLARFADWVENEKYSSHPLYHNNTLALLRAVRDLFSGDKLLLAGDLHMYFHMKVCSESSSSSSPAACIDEIITSGITNASVTIDKLTLGSYSAACIRWLRVRLEEWTGSYQEVYLANNYVVLDVHAGGGAGSGAGAGSAALARAEWPPGSASKPVTGATPRQRITWRTEFRPLSPKQRFWHTVHDWSLYIAVGLVQLWLLLLWRCCRSKPAVAPAGSATRARKSHVE